MFGDYQLSLHDYLSILRRRALVMILVFGAVLTASVVYALLQPKIYESTATILVEGPQVEVAVGNRANQPRPEDRVNLIQQRLMTRESLIRIAGRHELFVSEGNNGISDTALVKAMRNSIRLDLRGGEATPWGSRSAPISFDVSFRSDDPDKALAVTRDLAELFLAANLRDRVDQASRTTGFLSDEAERVRKELEALEAKMAAFKSRQAGAMPENLALSLAGLQSMESDLRTAELEQRVAQSELRSLEVDLAAARRGVTAPGVLSDPGPSETEQELGRARAELASRRAVYSESHPDVRALVRRIEGLEKAVNSTPNVQTPTRTAAREQAGLVVSRLEAQVDAARTRVELLSTQRASLRANIAQLRAQAVNAPQLERQLTGLQREQEATQARYNELRTQLSSAQVVENLEDNQQVERFTLLEPPLLPELPVSSRRKIALAGVVVAAGAALGIALLLEFFFARVWGANALAAAINHQPLGVIPFIANRADVNTYAVWSKRVVWMGLGVGALLLLAVHFWVMPIQDMLTSITSRQD